MVACLFGRKIGMTQVFDSDGAIQRVTVLEMGPCRVIDQRKVKVRGAETTKVRIGYESIKGRLLTRPERGVYRKCGQEAFRVLKEVDCGEEVPDVGSDIKVDLFEGMASVDVTGVSKGKGFQGVIKRWGFKGGPASHGSMFHRTPGAVGQCAYPGEIFKGRKMPGRQGGRRSTQLNLKVVRVEKERGLLLVRGSVPGRKGTLVMVKKSVKSACRGAV